MNSRFEDFINQLSVDSEYGADTPLIQLDNLATYLYIEKHIREFDLVNLPNLAPPWPAAIFTWSCRCLDHGIMADFLTIVCGFPLTAGGWILALQSRGIRAGDSVSPFAESFRLINADGTLKAKFTCLDYVSAFEDANLPDLAAAMSGYGELQAEGVVPFKIGYLDWDSNECFAPLDEKDLEGVNHWAFFAETVPLVALTFCHCRNVELVEKDASRSFRRRRARMNLPAIKFRVIDINPVQKVLAPHTSQGETVSRALHICRGHFKDYRQRGLFGKNRGLYWWDMHMRGTVEQGRVVKDYRIADVKGASNGLLC